MTPSGRGCTSAMSGARSISSSPRSNANCWPARASDHTSKPDGSCSPSSRAGTTSAAGTAPSATTPQSATKRCINKKCSLLASCPPQAGVVVVIGDPPTDRGQLMQSPNLEEINRDKIQQPNRPPKRVTPMSTPTAMQFMLDLPVSLRRPQSSFNFGLAPLAREDPIASYDHSRAGRVHFIQTAITSIRNAKTHATCTYHFW
ncbi:hypothetical protein BN2475_560007 [Paraburkholderia ribeironis]|uniref:Uncharacterized protein n=1 Tax=Paraburkholderia ribeironis TaxID=1247936 RepID=A0A1N7SDQ8_9BURK|nr:hypothetical protein BN2475_560007 [Paraburkholderia ribeironis]